MGSDGSIIIDTQLDNEGFQRGSDKLLSAIKDLINAVDNLSDNMMSSFQQIIPMLQSIASAFEQSGQAAQQAFGSYGKSAGGATQKLSGLEKETYGLADKLENLSLRAQMGFSSQSQLDNFILKVEQIARKVEEAKGKVDEFGNTKFVNTAYIQAETQLEALEQKLHAAYEEQERLLAQKRNPAVYFGTFQHEIDSSLAKLQKDIDKLEAARQALDAKIVQFEQSGAKYEWKGSDTEAYANMVQYLERASELLSQIRGETGDGIPAPTSNNINAWQMFGNAVMNSMRELASSSLSRVRQGLSAVYNLALRLSRLSFNKLKSGLASFGNGLKSIISKSTQTDNLVKKLTGSFLGLKRMLITRLKRTFVSYLFSTLKTALSEMSNYSSALKNSINNLKSAASGLAGNLAISFGGLITAIEPILTKLINLISTAITYINAFFALLGGKTTVSVAKGYTSGLNDAAGAAGSAAKAQKELNEQIYSFDELNKRDDTSSGGSGGGGGGSGGAGSGISYDTVPIDSLLPDSIKDFMQRIKDAITDGDWVGVGNILAEGLNHIVSVVDNWNINTFRPKAQEWAVNITDTLNGLFAGWDAKATGGTVAELFNTVIYTVRDAVENFDWGTFGTRVGELFTGIFRKVDLNETANMLTGGVNGILNSVYNAVTTFPWEEAGMKLAGGWNTLIEKVDWELLGTTVGTAISNFWDMISSWANSTHWEEHGKKIAEGFRSLLESKPISSRMEAIKNVFNGLITWLGSFTTNFPWKSLKDEMSSALSKILDINIGDLVLNLGKLIIGFVHALATAVVENKAKFKEFGEKVGNALAQLDWGQLLSDVATIIVSGLGSLLSGFMSSDSGGVVAMIAAGLAMVKIAKGAFSVFGALVAKTIWESITASAAASGEGLLSSIASGLISTAGLATLFAATAVVGGIIVGEVVKWQQQIENYYGQFDRKAEELRAKWESAKQDLEDELQALELKKAKGDKLLNEYDDISGQDSLSVDDYARLQEIVQALVTLYPDLNAYVDAESGLFNTSTKEIRDNTQALIESAKAKAYMSALEEAMSIVVEQELNYKHALDKASKSQQLYNALIERWNLLADMQTAYTSGSTDEYERLSAELDNNTKSLEDNADLLSELGISVDDLALKNDNFLEAIGNVSTATNALGDAQASEQAVLDDLADAVATANSEYDMLSAEVLSVSEESAEYYANLKKLSMELMRNSASAESATSTLRNYAKITGMSESETASLISTFEDYLAQGYTVAEATDLISQYIDNIGSSASDTAQAIEDADISGTVSDTADNVLKTVEDTTADAEQLTSGTLTTIAKNMKSGGRKIKKEAGNVAEGAYESMNSKTSAMSTIGSTMGGNMKSGIASMIEKVKAQANKTSQDAYDAFGSKTGATTQTGSTYGENLRKGITSQLEAITAAANITAKNVYDAFASHVNDVTKVGKDYGGNLYTGLNAKLNTLKLLAGTIARNVYNALSSYSNTYTIGYNLGLGLYNGIIAMSTQVVNAAKALATNVINTVKTIFKISSPSKVFTDIGENNDEGLINGINNLRGRVLSTAKDLATDVIGASDIDGDSAFTLSADSLTDGLDRITSRLSTVAQLFMSIGGALNGMGGLYIPDIVNGSVMPIRASVASGNGYSGGFSTEMANSLETQNNLLREQNNLLQQLINVSGNSVVDVSDIMNGFSRINRRTGKSVVQIG